MDNIVYNETRTAYLKQHSIKDFNLAKDCDQYSDSLAVVLYASNFADFRALPGKYDKEVIKAISAVLKANQMEKDEKERFQIYMIPKYDRFFDEMIMLFKLNSSQEFIDKLCTIVAKPKIRIKWELRTAGNPNAEESKVGNLEIPFKAGESLSGIQGFDFYVSKLLFNYSVMLEWQESSRSSQGHHYLRPNLEEKLWNEMLLADCTIVSSDGTENKCHRNVR
ncbi:unnamed protein product [Orchesella dallaii]|uniref:Uncharacterized protein n=1 Tax=Orchesella dallaii TaxID=48710 RepID=A0ABP1RU24_9HEXA